MLILNPVLVIFLVIPLTSYGQEKNNSTKLSEKRFTIENCVNQFAIDKADKTKSGYRYWFADKDFIDGRTLKMSFVDPNQATHGRINTRQMSSFLFWKEQQSFIWMGKQSR